MLCGWKMSLNLNCLFCLFFALNISILNRTFFAWFLICFGIMLSYICIFLSCLHVVYLFLFGSLVFILFCFPKKKKNYKNSVCFVYIGTCSPWMAIETKFSKLCIFCNLDEHLYAQLSKWALWLVFVMSKIKWSLVLNTRITLFNGND